MEVALPIGPPPEGFYPPAEHPEIFDENGRMRLPDEGVITFTLDVTGMTDRVVTEHPCIPVATDLVTAQVTEACFSPLMTYITLDLEVNPDAMARLHRGQRGWLLRRRGAAYVVLRRHGCV